LIGCNTEARLAREAASDWCWLSNWEERRRCIGSISGGSIEGLCSRDDCVRFDHCFAHPHESVTETLRTHALCGYARALGNSSRRDTTMTKAIVLAALAFTFAAALEIRPELAMVLQQH
jgi:hypothetical protein